MLPLQLITFSGVKNDDNIVLNCPTANEKKIRWFTIKCSFTGKDFISIGSVAFLNAISFSYAFNDVDEPAFVATGYVDTD